MAMAIISTVLPLITCTFFGLVGGITSIVFASQVNSKYANGDYEGAKKSAKYAKIAWIIAIVILVGQIAFFVVTIMMSGEDFFEQIQKEIERQQSLQNQ
ncbi:hypothetical protein GCM10010832_10220 [Psychroflexus planctonicus]|uniref:Interferon-induced transmembrane protein n=2 Tax=Psychroflexus planctonicus TaxID=1526575 RepID=A0ABQ1SDT1_9FLAO|nr:hypothetical protein GCM10010832_10220 [Psychroflexus planctonicus]